jgi:hypothetical protein
MEAKIRNTEANFACDWWPLGHNLNVTGRQSHAISAPTGRQLFATTLREQLFELKNEDAI